MQPLQTHNSQPPVPYLGQNTKRPSGTTLSYGYAAPPGASQLSSGRAGPVPPAAKPGGYQFVSLGF